MPEIHIEQPLENLKQSLKKIKTLLAWEQLRLAETAPAALPQLNQSHSEEKDLRNQYTYFLATSFDLGCDLASTNPIGLPPDLLQSYRQQLMQLEGEFRALQLNRRFDCYSEVLW